MTCARGAHLVEHLGDERLTAETGLHAHHQQHVELAEVRLDRRRRASSGSNDSPARMPEVADLVEQRPRVAELDVDGAAVGTGVGEQRQQHLGVVDHQVAVEEQVGVRAQAPSRPAGRS